MRELECQCLRVICPQCGGEARAVLAWAYDAQSLGSVEIECPSCGEISVLIGRGRDCCEQEGESEE